MTQVHLLAIELAKRSFQVCATDRGGACVDAPSLARRCRPHLTPLASLRPLISLWGSTVGTRPDNLTIPTNDANRRYILRHIEP